MGKQPRQPQRMRSTKIAHHAHRREKSTDDHRNKQADQTRQTRTLTRAANEEIRKKQATMTSLPSPPPVSMERGDSQTGSKRTEEPAAARPTQYGHRNRQAEPTPIAEPSRPASREAGRGEDDKRTRGKQAEGKRQGTDDTAGEPHRAGGRNGGTG